MWEDETGLSWLSMSSLVRNTLLPSHWALIGWAVDVGSISSHYLDVSPFLLICPGPSPSSQVSLGRFWLDFIHIYEDKRLLNFLELLPFISFFLHCKVWPQMGHGIQRKIKWRNSRDYYKKSVLLHIYIFTITVWTTRTDWLFLSLASLSYWPHNQIYTHRQYWASRH